MAILSTTIEVVTYERKRQVKVCDICGADATDRVPCDLCKTDLCGRHQVSLGEVHNYDDHQRLGEKRLWGTYCLPCAVEAILRTFGES